MLPLKFLYTLAHIYFFFECDLGDQPESVFQVENLTVVWFIISIKAFIKTKLKCRHWRYESTFCITVS
jgi:hypothetical protein